MVRTRSKRRRQRKWRKRKRKKKKKDEEKKREDEDEEKRENEIKHEATPESQEHRIEIRAEVPRAEYPDFGLDLTQTILEMRLDAASKPEIVEGKKQKDIQVKEEMRLNVASNPEVEKEKCNAPIPWARRYYCDVYT